MCRVRRRIVGAECGRVSERKETLPGIEDVAKLKATTTAWTTTMKLWDGRCSAQGQASS